MSKAKVFSEGFSGEYEVDRENERKQKVRQIARDRDRRAKEQQKSSVQKECTGSKVKRQIRRHL